MATHIEQPGKGVMFWEAPEKRKSEKAPDWKGFLILKMDYKAGEKLQISGWRKQTAFGDLVSLSEDTYSKERREGAAQEKEAERHVVREVTPKYARAAATRPDLDDDIPFN